MANIRIRDQGKITLKDSDNSNEVSLQSPSTVSSSQDFIVPNADGSANKIINLGIRPNYILGDLDSIYKKNIKKKSKNIIHLKDQNYNDFHKSLLWLKENNIKKIDIIGIDGKRIDHTICNFIIILECISFIDITIFTDYGNIYTVDKFLKTILCPRNKQ